MSKEQDEVDALIAQGDSDMSMEERLSYAVVHSIMHALRVKPGENTKRVALVPWIAAIFTAGRRSMWESIRDRVIEIDASDDVGDEV